MTVADERDAGGQKLRYSTVKSLWASKSKIGQSQWSGRDGYTWPDRVVSWLWMTLQDAGQGKSGDNSAISEITNPMTKLLI